MKRIGIVGAGFSGAVIAEQLAASGFYVDIFDNRSHVGGNCHTERDDETGIMVHLYGPHIFHTSNEKVWNYVNRFDTFLPFINRVKTVFNGRVFSLPINLLTIHSFFNKTFNPKQAKDFIDSISDKSILNPLTFEEQALRFIGRDLYEAFFKGYTQKQWGLEPNQLPASILKRLPVRFNYDDNYYSSKYQGIPLNGYSHVIRKMLSHPNINLKLNSYFTRNMSNFYDHIFYSGPIDSWFNYQLGNLSYRTLKFEIERHIGDYQGNPVINYSDLSIPYTRISEHKHFSPWELHEKTIIYKEYSSDCSKNDIPYYPVRLSQDKQLLKSYLDLASNEKNISFVGRLGTYRYLDMHITIEEALNSAEFYLNSLRTGNQMPVFCIDPL